MSRGLGDVYKRQRPDRLEKDLSQPAVQNVLKTFGYTGGLAVTYILLGIAFLLTIWWQRFFFKKNKQ